MLTVAENDRITRVGAGTPGGTLFRRYWLPAALAEELPERDGPPIRVRLLGEKLVAFRDSDGVVGLMEDACPHRRAPMFFGRNEECGLRCVYHGWKFDCSGQCVEAPAERAGFERNVQIPVFPTGEAFGLIYGFFGDDEPPQFPPYPESYGEGIIEARPIEHVPCNYLQSFENSMDEVHVAFTHSPGGSHALLAQDLPIITAEETAWGMMRYGKRPSGMVRHTLHIAPNIVRVIVPPPVGMDGVVWPEISFHFTPVDDENHLWVRTAKYRMTGTDVDVFRQKREELYARRAAAPAVESIVEDIWSGRIAYNDVRHPELAVVQDIAVQAGQGKITDREAETLGRSDAGIAVWRRILERELQIIADGGQPKKWERTPEDVVPIIGV